MIDNFQIKVNKEELIENEKAKEIIEKFLRENEDVEVISKMKLEELLKEI